jgi:hypothetical protein
MPWIRTWWRIADALHVIRDISARIRRVSSSVDIAAMEVEELKRHLRRARDTVAILYVGNKARRADGTVDVDEVIDSVLGDA